MTVMLCFCQTLLHIQGRVGRGIVVVKEPVTAAPHFLSFLPYIIAQFFLCVPRLIEIIIYQYNYKEK